MFYREVTKCVHYSEVISTVSFIQSVLYQSFHCNIIYIIYSTLNIFGVKFLSNGGGLGVV